ncbi:MAG TPA: CaiB/BaiF CoA-transferase family protein [Pseudomonadales bacterium]
MSGSAPLAGLRVLELASILAGPVTGQFLAELGADVVKVENPATGGDPTRSWRLRQEDPANPIGAYFSCANWGKRSIALNVAVPAGRAVVHDLARAADVVIASYKPGDDVKLGLDPATLCAENPRLIYAQISAYGNADPRPGFDAIIQAESGFTYLNGEADGPPVKMPVALMDLLAAHQLKEAILLALLVRERTGAGRHVHVSLLEAAVASLANQASNYLVAGVVPERMGSEHPNIAPYGSIFRLGDGRELVLAVGTERQWQNMVQVIERPELARDPRFADNVGRVAHRQALRDELERAFAALDGTEAARRLGAAGVPFGFVNDMAAVFQQPTVRQRLLQAAVPGAGTLQGVPTFVADGFAAGAPSAPPPFNAHGRQILRELGYGDERLRELIEQGAWPGDTNDGAPSADPGQ